jgi:bifunctional DNA-binding transcriptional regulator/antitoxin component of YhaV-PrlF toxin-antitoxin module
MASNTRCLFVPTETTDEDIPFFAEVTAGGRITIPEEIRKIFEIKDGDAVFCRIKIMKKKEANSVPVKEAKAAT